jgi:hypothetical protein
MVKLGSIVKITAGSSSTPASLSPSLPSKKKSKEENKSENEEIGEEEIEKEPFRLGDALVDLIFLFKSSTAKKFYLFIPFFLSLGFLHKIWIWFSACVLHRYGAPCKENFSLTTMPFIYKASWMDDEEMISPHLFSFLDTGHIALSIHYLMYILVIYGGCRHVIWKLLCFVGRHCKTKYQAFSRSVKRRAVIRRKAIQNQSEKKKQ